MSDPDVFERWRSRLAQRAPHVAVVIAIAIALMGALDWTITGADNLKRVAVWLGLAKDSKDDARMEVLRSQYPLEPLSFDFQFQYPMDTPALASYSARLQAGLVAYLRKMRQDRKPTSDDLHDEDITFVINNFSNDPELRSLMPSSNEGAANIVLLQDDTVFHIFGKNDKGDIAKLPATITFFCTDPDLAAHIEKLPSHGDVSQVITLNADFKLRMFVKEVRCKNLVRLKPNQTANSALDLVDRELSWDPTVRTGDTVTAGTLLTIAIIFPFQSQDSPHNITVEKNQTQLSLTPQDLGLEALVKG
jgi:hypothetical protein